MAKPIYTLEEIVFLLCECEGTELLKLRFVVLDDYRQGRYSREDFSNIWTLIDRKLTTGRLLR